MIKKKQKRKRLESEEDDSWIHQRRRINYGKIGKTKSRTRNWMRYYLIKNGNVEGGVGIDFA